VDVFWIDLSRLIRKWTEAGESVVLLEDWNTDVRGEKTRKFMVDLGMTEVITEFHGDAGPHAYNRGSKPIYGIFMTQDLYIFQCGYMPFGTGIGSDHRCLWIDIREARRFKCDDPKVRNRYIKHYEQYIEKKQLLDRSRKLASDAKELGLIQQQAQ
jgi:hypothetical protein